jgi:magnesium-transporting ATPase (P-type)
VVNSQDQARFNEFAFNEALLNLHCHSGDRLAKRVIVFVHGLGGNGYNTWEKFPQFVFDDPSRDPVDVALFDYFSGHRTAGFTTLVFAQLFNAFNSRSETTTAFRHLFSNRWLWASVALGVVLQIAVVQLPVLQAGFGTATLDLAHWGVAIAMASSVLWFDELRKLVLRIVLHR